MCAHAGDDDLVPELLAHAAAIPCRYDLIVTTDTEEKKARMEANASGHPGIDEVIVLVTAPRGRDMGALCVAGHDLMTSGRYHLVCRVHTRTSPHLDAALGNLFKHQTLGNVLPGRAGGAAHPLFDTRYDLGVNADVRDAAFNPLIHFVLYGHRKGHNPQRDFDVAFYRSAYPDIAESSVNPLVDHLGPRDCPRRNANRGFYGQRYLEDHPDVAAANSDPLIHFVRWGRAEQRRIRALP